MDIQQKIYTADDLWELSHRAGDAKRYELLNGELIEMSPTGEIHGIVVAWLTYLITAHADTNNLGEVLGAETGFQITDDPDTVLAPDIAFISESRRQKTTAKYLKIAPDLAVEVISPSNTVAEIEDKIAAFFAAGTRLMWILHPKPRTVHVYTSPEKVEILTVKDTLTGGNVLPGFKIPVADIFKKLRD